MEKCFNAWKEEDGNNLGKCCCNCKYHFPAVAHPWNKEPFLNGNINRQVAWACIAPELEKVTLSDLEMKHSICEIHEFRKL